MNGWMIYNAQMIQLYKELPSFANNENKELNRNLQNEFNEFKNLINECEDLQNRVKAIKQQHIDTEKWLTDKRNELNLLESQIDEELHKISMIKGEKESIKIDIDKFKDKIASVNWKTREIQSKIHIAEDRILFFEGKAQENSESLNYFQKIVAENEELLTVLQKNHKEDAIIVKNMISQIEKQENMLNVMKKRLDDEVSTTKTLQTELNTFSTQYQKIYDENQQILQLMNTPISTLMSINKEIQEKSQFCKEKQEKYQKIFDENQIEKQNLDQILKENKDFDLKIKDLYNKVNIATNELDLEENGHQENLQNIQTLSHNLIKLQNDENFYKNQNEKIESEIQVEMNKKAYYQKRLDDINAVYESRTDYTTYLQEIKTKFQNELEETQNELNKRDKLITYYKNKKQKLIDENIKIKNQIIEINNDKKTRKHVSDALTHKMIELDDVVNAQEEEMNKINKIQRKIEEKIEQYKNIPKPPSKLTQLQSEIIELRKVRKNSKEKVISSKERVSSIDVEIKKRIDLKGNLEKEKENLENQISVLNLEIEAYNRRNFDSIKEVRDKTVEVNLLRLKISNYSEPILESSKIIETEEDKYKQLIESAKTRLRELDEQHLSIISRLNSEEKEKHEISMKLSETKHQIELQKLRYDEETKPVAKNEEKSLNISEVLLNYTKEREILMKRKEELENKIQSALNESNALQRATLKLNHINVCRNNEKLSEESEYDQLKDTIKKLNEEIKIKVSEFNKMNLNREILKQRLEKTSIESSNINKNIMKIVSKIKSSKNDIEFIENEIKTQTNVINMHIANHRNTQGVDLKQKYPFSKFEIQIETEVKRNTIETAIFELQELSKDNKEIKQRIHNFISQEKIKLRPTPPLHPISARSYVRASPQKNHSNPNFKSQRESKLTIKNITLDIK